MANQISITLAHGDYSKSSVIFKVHHNNGIMESIDLVMCDNTGATVTMGFSPETFSIENIDRMRKIIEIMAAMEDIDATTQE